MAFKAPGADEFTGTQFVPASEDIYRCRIDRYEVKEGADSVSQYNPDGNPRVRFYLEPLFIESDKEALMVDINDEELPEDKLFIMFFDPDHLGTKPRLAKSRKFLASALQIGNEVPVEYDTLEEMADDMINREVVCSIEVKGEYNNIVDTNPVKDRKPRRKRTEKSPLVEAAEATFDESAEESDEDNDY
jgi:hypothetical protein